MVTRPDTDRTFQRVFGNLYGIPCWGAKRDQGESLTIEFGTPHFTLHHMGISGNVSLQTLLDLARRAICVRGDWHLEIHSGLWKIMSGNNRQQISSTSGLDQSPGIYLNGYKLVRFSIHPQKAVSSFEFDSGNILKTWTHCKTEGQWSLQEPWGKVLELRGDKRYSYHCACRVIQQSDWKPIRVREFKQ